MNPRQLSPCLVCSDSAVGINFGVPTCAPCKAFFRRNAVKLGKIDFVCQEDGDCPVTYQSRRICSCCRLAKCFRVGMKRALILSDTEREARKELVQQNRLKRAQGVVMQNVNLVQPMPTLFTTDRLSKYLAPSDHDLLHNIYNAYESTSGLTGQARRWNMFPLVYTSLHEFVNAHADQHKSVVEYIKLVPEFLRLTMDDKIRILRGQCGLMININETILGESTSNNLFLSVRNVFPPDIGGELIRAFELLNFYRCDPVLLKLVLITRSLSSGMTRYRRDNDMGRVYDDTLAIFHSQNVYAELLWRYILSRSTSDGEAVKFLNKLILDLLFLQRACYGAGGYVYDMEHEISRMYPLMQSMWPQSAESDNGRIADIEDELEC